MASVNHCLLQRHVAIACTMPQQDDKVLQTTWHDAGTLAYSSSMLSTSRRAMRLQLFSSRDP
eukprot:scaffold116160_cov21-Prasinocladus_malaysianus.AAC.1